MKTNSSHSCYALGQITTLFGVPVLTSYLGLQRLGLGA